MIEIPHDDDVATLCDDCSSPILYNERAYSTPTGEKDEETGAPYVRILCAKCYVPGGNRGMR